MAKPPTVLDVVCECLQLIQELPPDQRELAVTALGHFKTWSGKVLKCPPSKTRVPATPSEIEQAQADVQSRNSIRDHFTVEPGPVSEIQAMTVSEAAKHFGYEVSSDGSSLVPMDPSCRCQISSHVDAPLLDPYEQAGAAYGEETTSFYGNFGRSPEGSEEAKTYAERARRALAFGRGGPG